MVEPRKIWIWKPMRRYGDVGWPGTVQQCPVNKIHHPHAFQYQDDPQNIPYSCPGLDCVSEVDDVG